MSDAIEAGVDAWRRRLQDNAAISADDVSELEGHLRDTIQSLRARGLSPDEALWVAIKRMGAVDALVGEYAHEHNERLWKQHAVEQPGSAPTRSRLLWAIGLALGAAMAVKLLSPFGVLPLDGEASFRNLPVMVLPFLAVFFLVSRPVSVGRAVAVALPFVVLGALLNLYPFEPNGQTEVLAVIHAAVVLWGAVGLAHMGAGWRSGRARMDFVRFTGEWCVYYVLIALGGGLICGLTLGLFAAMGLDAGVVVSGWMLPCGAAAAVIVAAWLVEGKKNVIENIVPVLARIFAPLMTALLVAAAIAAVLTVNTVHSGRDLLIVFDLALLAVLALLLYSMSARRPDAPASWFDWLQLVMLVAAIAVDVIVLVAMIGRIGAYGVSANKLTSLGLNVILVVNLAVAAWLQIGFLRRRNGFGILERWQTSSLPVYFAWAAFVAIAVPPLFAFV